MRPKRRVRFEVDGAVFEDASFDVLYLSLANDPPIITFARAFQGGNADFFKNAHGSTSTKITVFHDEQGLQPWMRWTGGTFLYGIQAWPSLNWPDIRELVQIANGAVEVFEE